MNSDEDRIEAWLDGSLPGDERRFLEASLGTDAALARRVARAHAIDASLRRSFHAPATAGAWALSASSRTTPTAVPRSFVRILPWLVAAAAAVALIWVSRSLRPSATGPGSTPHLVVDSPSAGPGLADLGCDLIPALDACSSGPLLSALCEEPCAVDLATLYREVTGSPTVFAACTDVAGLREEMSTRFGEDVPLGADAADQLHGPYTSSAWPTGAVYTADTGGAASVLVAESEDYVTQCLDLVVADAAGLYVFDWRVGGLHLTEITPHPEPRLLQLFDVR